MVSITTVVPGTVGVAGDSCAVPQVINILSIVEFAGITIVWSTPSNSYIYSISKALLFSTDK